MPGSRFFVAWVRIVHPILVILTKPAAATFDLEAPSELIESLPQISPSSVEKNSDGRGQSLIQYSDSIMLSAIR
jgi:hypothetical protein